GEALSRFHRERDEWAKPFYDLTCEMARFAPPTPESTALYEALRSQPEEVSRFLGLITEAASPTEFFAPDHIGPILGAAGIAKADAAADRGSKLNRNRTVLV
ncbi:MAG: hypothetical protein ACRD2A_23425, partial [Vicinamibacterales bacterium]